MSETKAKFTVMASHKDLQKAYDGSYYFIGGAGGDIDEWVDGYNDLLAQEEMGQPREWFATNGAAINLFATERAGAEIVERDQFPSDLTCLLFPLDDLHVGKLAIFKMRMQDRWFDDVIQNMRSK